MAQSIWNLWLGVALATLLTMVIHGIIYGLTFKSMAVILAIGAVLWACATACLWLKTRRTQGQASSAVMAQDDTIRLNHE